LKVDENYFLWRYLNNPNKDLLVCAAIDQGRVVANYSATEFRLLNRDNELLKSAQSLNTMTDPDYQGQGLFMKTANALYEEMKKRDYDLIWGFPNNLSHWIFKNKLLWKDIYEFPTLSLKVNNQKQYSTKDLRVVNSSNVNELLFSKYYTKNHYQIDKTSEYLKWRYIDHPVNAYYFYYYDVKSKENTVDYIILKEYDNKLNIVELEAESSEALKALLDFALDFAINNRLEYVTIFSSINSILYNFVETYGFWLDLPIFHLGARSFNMQDIGNFRWNISQGDNNIF
jgi:GNAT superfamily N-acetyltransferase